MSGRFRSLGLCAAIATVCLWPLLAMADCDVAKGVATCSGDLSSGVSFINTINLLKVENLTADITIVTDAVLGANAPGDQTPAGDIAIDYSGGSFLIETFDRGLVGQSQGRNGDNEKGEPGAASGNASVTFQSGTITAPEASSFLLAESLGGSGGTGDEDSPVGGTANGGAGAVGGASGQSSVTLVQGDFSVVTVLGQSAFWARSLAGAGGAGGEGTTGAGSAFGGSGGNGGSAESAQLTIAQANLSLPAVSERAMEVVSEGGAGGDGGEANVTVGGAANAGQGGAGGSSRGASLQVMGGDFSVGSNGIIPSNGGLLQVQSSGGDAGTGGIAKSTFGNSTGGKGGAGGAGGPLVAELDGGRFTVGPQGTTAILLQSSGGDGGDGGEADVRGVSSRGQGGDGGQGGAAGSVTVTSKGAGVTITTSSTSKTQHALRVESVAGSGGDGGEGKSTVAGNGDGGDGGQGGAGGDVSVQLVGDISTAGPSSQGVFARSYGGNGGDGGKGSAFAGDGKGGAAAGDGPAGNASIDFSGSIETSGEEANAIIVQSVGGFSGDAGTSVGFLAFGASGESAGGGGTVSATLAEGSSLKTQGQSAAGILAQSIGGGGGRGSTAVGLGAALGGTGSAGGDGGMVTVSSAGTIETSGQRGRGIHAASRGGGGGDGGTSVSIVEFGGAGGSGGDGGEVTVANAARVSTTGDQADGLYASSLGGGGGSAHTEVGFFSIGGTGGQGGSGDSVTAGSSASISTVGDDADGVFLSSIGGGGGDGSAVIDVGAAVEVAIGGGGGPGGDGGAVTYDDQGAEGYSIETAGERARGLYAASVGGGGGDGGTAVSVGISPVLNVSVGASGDGANAGSGGAISVTSGADIATKGDHAAALSAHSTGGGGGSAGTTVSSSAAPVTFAMAIGGNGGEGGDGGLVSLAADGDLSTQGHHSAGIAAVSHGGGGGTGGTSIAATAADSEGISVSLALGGKGGRGGAGGDVSVGGSGLIATAGDLSPGLYAHSVAGSGGVAGTTVAASGITSFNADLAVGSDGGGGEAAGSVEISVAREITTKGHISPGLAAQSIGGSGGHGGATVAADLTAEINATLALGGTGGAGGDGGPVSLTSQSAIMTEGHSSAAILAHSIGGGGGSAHFTTSLQFGTSEGTAQVSVGGSGGAAGNGGEVTVTTETALTTVGHNAPGISALSIGGGGGDSGTTLTAEKASSGTITATVGGDGGTGGSGGPVSVTAMSDVTTSGHHSVGIGAKSISQSGGSAGAVSQGSIISGLAVSSSVGGSGGEGGISGKASLSSQGNVTTKGSYANALEAQSLAGGGGSAKVVLSANTMTIGNLDVTVGGAGGSSGSAGAVSMTNKGVVKTEGHHARGMLAQSLGVSGGDGGVAAEGGFTSDEFGGQIGVTIGGSGGTSGQAGDVTVSNVGSITTENLRATGVLAQSIGGNGGTGGGVYTGNMNLSSTASAQIDVAIGGSGGDGAQSGQVMVENLAQISTVGFLADGILAQSIGGNGGSGGGVSTLVANTTGQVMANIQVAVGGSGGGGGQGAAVTVTNSGEVGTERGGSNGIRAQSIGGGGGVGGAAGTINLQLSPSGLPASEGNSFSGNVDISVGGSGGFGSHAGPVSLTNEVLVVTNGDIAKGLIAESIGGGGGYGGPASATTISFAGACSLTEGLGKYDCSSSDSEETTTIDVSLSLAIGGNGGGAGNGDVVDLTNSGAVQTSGEVAHALVAHSIGGGGGNGGEGDMGVAGWTTNAAAEAIDNLGTTFTSLPSFTDIEATIGGRGGAAGDGGNVTIKNPGALVTQGAHAYAIHAQSIGGGGGNAGAGSSGIWSALTVGGSGSGGGEGGDLTVTHAGTIETFGEGGVGIFAQSVGGGGGTAGDVEKTVTSAWDELNLGVGVGIQQNGGKGGDGGQIEVVTSGAIKTEGQAAHGMVLQSVGGSGGAASVTGLLGSQTFNTYAGSAGDAGNGGSIFVTVGEAIEVTGDQAHGIFAQSVSGSGTQDSGGGVTMTINADVIASGDQSRAILAQTEGRSSNGVIRITIAEGATVQTSANGAETIGLFDGSNNIITNKGSLVQEAGPDAAGFVIRTNGTAVLNVDNEGLIAGSVLTARKPSVTPAGVSSVAATAPARGILFTNKAGATFAMGSEVSLGAEAGWLQNEGLMSAAGTGSVGLSRVTGLVTQSSTGTLWVDFGDEEGADLITLAGAEGNSLAGKVMPNPLGVIAGKQALPILMSLGSLGSSDLTVTSTSTVDYSLSQRANSAGQEVLFLDYSVDYTPWNGSAAAQAKVPGSLREVISPNHTAFGDSIDGMIDTSNSNTEAFVSDLTNFLLTTESVTDLVDVYDRFAPAEIFAPSDAALFSSLRFADDLNSCPARGPEGQVVFTQQGSCVWLQVNGGGIDRQRTSNSIDYDESFVGVSVGGQMAVGEGYFLGGAFGYEDSNLSNSRFSGDGSRFQGGIVAKKEIEATTISASFSGGVGIYDLSRQVITPSGTVTADSSPNVNWISGHARVSHVVDLNEEIYVKPWFDLGIDHQWQGSFSETGAGDYGLDVESFSQTLVTLNPVVELGSDFQIFGAEANASASAGLLAIVSGRDRSTGVQLRGMGGFGPTYEISDQARPLFADVGANFEVRVHERALISLGGQALLAGNQQEYGGTGRVSIFF